jgi:hypothetical protein
LDWKSKAVSLKWHSRPRALPSSLQSQWIFQDNASARCLRFGFDRKRIASFAWLSWTHFLVNQRVLEAEDAVENKNKFSFIAD